MESKRLKAFSSAPAQSQDSTLFSNYSQTTTRKKRDLKKQLDDSLCTLTQQSKLTRDTAEVYCQMQASRDTKTLWDTQNYSVSERQFEDKYGCPNDYNFKTALNSYYEARSQLTLPKGFIHPDTYEYKQLNEELAVLKEHKDELESKDQDWVVLKNDKEMIEERLFELDKEKQKKDAEETCLTQNVLDTTDNVINPLFQVIIQVYGIATTLFRELSDRTERTISYISFGFGKLLSFINLFAYLRNTNTPQRKTKIAISIINIFAAIANTTVTVIRTNPYAQAIIGLSTITLSLYRDSYCLHQTRMAVFKEEAEIKTLQKELDDLERIERNLENVKRQSQETYTLTVSKKVRIERLKIQINHKTEALANKIENEKFENIRSVVFTTLNAVCGLFLLAGALAAGTTLLPPLWIPILTSLATTCASIQLFAFFFDIVDQFLKYNDKFPQYKISRWLAYDLPRHVVNAGNWLVNLPFLVINVVSLGFTSAPVEMQPREKAAGSAANVSRTLSEKSGKPVSFQPQDSAVEDSKPPVTPASKPAIVSDAPNESPVESGRYRLA